MNRKLSMWLAVAAAAVLTSATLLLLPRVASQMSGSIGPPVALVLAVGAVISAITGLAMLVSVRYTLKLPAATALYAVGFCVLVVVVKFVLSPLGLYEVNQVRAIEPFLNDPSVLLVVSGLMVFLLYLVVYWLIYRFFRTRVTKYPSVKRRWPKRLITTALVAGLILVVATLTSGFSLLLPYFFAVETSAYLSFVLTSGFALMVGTSLALAGALLAMCFKSAKDRGQAVGDASLLIGVFWLGLAFLALYHILWVVYILILTSIWPLKVVTSK